MIFLCYNCSQNYLHIAFESSPQIQLSKLINNFKTVSSRYIRKEFKEYLKPFYWKPFFGVSILLSSICWWSYN
ncbi:hypothetical protein GSY74_00475 [Sulfurovum sp. bin170]|uniref:transposase n=1 Tax=Sulfurovum sp. bin170 TaxID=2695268 RepID=UPI0013DF68B0|nr:hypothetical protein [Sulfurovum sp. bin170]